MSSATSPPPPPPPPAWEDTTPSERGLVHTARDHEKRIRSSEKCLRDLAARVEGLADASHREVQSLTGSLLAAEKAHDKWLKAGVALASGILLLLIAGTVSMIQNGASIEQRMLTVEQAQRDRTTRATAIDATLVILQTKVAQVGEQVVGFREAQGQANADLRSAVDGIERRLERRGIR